MNVTQIQPKPAPAPQAASGRMSLSNLVRGPIVTPLRVLAYGIEGVGKSTFAAGAPNPLFLGCDKGNLRLDIVRMPQPRTWDDVLEALRVVEHEAHDFKTLVIDTANSLEPLVFRKVTGGFCSIEDFGKGFGKGYNAALDHWRELLAVLERIWEARGMHIVLLAHTLTKGFNNPLGANYDRYEVAMNAKAAGLLKQWVDFVLFMREETTAKLDDQKNIKGQSTGARFLHTRWNAAYDAKSRGWLPEQLPLSWRDFFGAAHEGPARKAEFLASIDVGLAELGDAEVEAKVRGYLADPRVDVAEIANAIAIKVQAKRQADEAGK